MHDHARSCHNFLAKIALAKICLGRASNKICLLLRNPSLLSELHEDVGPEVGRSSSEDINRERIIRQRWHVDLQLSRYFPQKNRASKTNSEMKDHY